MSFDPVSFAMGQAVSGGSGGTDVSDTTATASDVLAGKYFYAADGAKTSGTITNRTSSDLTAEDNVVTVPAGHYAAQASKAVAAGTEGTPTAAKGSVSEHAITVTPSVTNAAGYIAGGTKTGEPVTVSAAELASGTKEINANGVSDVTGYAAVSVAVPLPTLNAPSLSLSGDTLSITNPSANGSFVTGYKVYAGNTLIATVQTATVDLSALLTDAGTYSITAKAYGTNFNDSAASTAVSYTVSAGYAVSWETGILDDSSHVGTFFVKADAAPSNNGDYDYYCQGNTTYDFIEVGTKPATASVLYMWASGGYSVEVNGSSVSVGDDYSTATAVVLSGNTSVTALVNSWDS